MGRVRLPHPVFEGDTIYAERVETRESNRGGAGIVRVKTMGINQSGSRYEFTRTFMVYKRGHVLCGARWRSLFRDGYHKGHHGTKVRRAGLPSCLPLGQ
jgi:hypothetical protein